MKKSVQQKIPWTARRKSSSSSSYSSSSESSSPLPPKNTKTSSSRKPPARKTPSKTKSVKQKPPKRKIQDEEDDSFLDDAPIPSPTPKKPKKKFKYSMERLLADHKKAQAQTPESLESSLKSSEEIESETISLESDEELNNLKDKTDQLVRSFATSETGLNFIPERIFSNELQMQNPEGPHLKDEGSFSNKTLYHLFKKDPKAVLESGWFLNCFQDTRNRCPDEILQWLFQVVAYDKENYLVALETFESLFRKLESAHHFTTGPTYGKEGDLENSNVFNIWTPSFEDFFDVFRNYGVEFEERKPIRSDELYKQKEIKEFPVDNFSAVIYLLGVFLKYSDTYNDMEKLMDLVILLFHFILDPCTTRALPYLESTISYLLLAFSKVQVDVSDFYEKLYSITKSCSNQLKIARSLPVTSQIGRKFQLQFSYYVACKISEMSTIEINSLSPTPQDIKNLIRTIVHRKEKNSEKLHTSILLIDLCITSKEMISRFKADELEKTKELLRTVNSQIRDTRGSDFSKTRLKDSIVLLITKLSLFTNLIPHKEQKTMEEFQEQVTS